MRYSLIIIAILFATNLAFGQAEPTASEVAAQLANPTTAPAAMSHNFDFTRFRGDLPGASDQVGFTYLFQPTIPLSSNVPRWTFRPAVPILLNQPVYNAVDGTFESETALGDIGFDLVYGTTFKNGIVLSGGLLGSIPTATSDKVASKQLQLGPNILFGVAGKWGVVGILAGHKWGIAGPGEKASITVASLFVTFPILDGTWQITSLPNISANQNLSGEKWSFPVNAGLAKTISLGSNIFRVGANYSYFVTSPDALGAKGLFRLTVTKNCQFESLIMEKLMVNKALGFVVSVGLFLFCFFSIGSIYAQQWEPITGKEKLRSLFSNTTVNWENGRGEYCADGSGVVFFYGTSFPRKWEIKNDQEACIASADGNVCYTFERNTYDPSEYRSRNMITDDREIIWIMPGGCGVNAVSEVLAKNWEPITEESEIRKIFDNKVYEWEGGRAEFCDNGTGTVFAYSGEFPRTWEVKDNGYCITSLRETICYTIEKSVEDPELFREKNLETGEFNTIRLSVKTPVSCKE